MSWETYVNSESVPHGEPACGRWAIDEPVERDFEAMVASLPMQLSAASSYLRDAKLFEIVSHHKHTPESGWRIKFERYSDE